MIDAIDANVTVGPRDRAATSGSRSFGHELDAALGARRTPARVSTDPAGRPLAQPTAECAEPAPDEVADEVETSEAMMPGVVSLPHGWGHDVEGMRMRVAKGHPGVPSNVLTDDARMDLASGNAVLNGIPVEVVPVAS